jgi:hypothetical protein
MGSREHSSLVQRRGEIGQCPLRAVAARFGDGLRVGMLLVVAAEPVFAEIVAGDAEDGVDVVGVAAGRMGLRVEPRS